MPVLLTRGGNGPIVLGSKREVGASQFARRSLDVALINNMPDSALESTERQFAELLAAASSDLLVRLRLYSLPDVPRSVSARRYIDNNYSSLDGLWDARPDGLIVTGTEPRAAELTDEPYWRALAEIVDWAQYTTTPTIWSCLAAHAAVLHMDGIRRRRLAEKRSGIFECANISNDPLAAGLPNRFAVPHSRFNDLDQSELAASGYTIFSTSERAGVDTFIKRSRGTFMFFQGHLEYETDTLFREYRRDVGRFLKGEREEYPAMPERYFSSKVQTRLLAFREQALADRREALLADFPSAKEGLSNTWRAPATRIYRNWLGILSAGKKWRAGRTATSQTRKSVHSQPASRPSRLHAAESSRLASVGFSGGAPRAVKRASEPGSAT